MTETMLGITVIGGGGMIGQRIFREAVDRGHRVTVVVREPPKIGVAHESVTVVQGDVLDPAALADLLADQDVAISAVGTARAAMPEYSLYRDAAESLPTALRRLGDAAPRLIVVGGVGSLNDGSGRLLLERVPEDRLPEHLGQKAALDLYRATSDVHWTYVSPPARIVPGERTGAYRLGGDDLLVDSNGESTISMEDYAVAVIDEAESPKHARRRFTVAY